MDQREDDRRRLGVRLHDPRLRDWHCRAEAFRRFGGAAEGKLGSESDGRSRCPQGIRAWLPEVSLRLRSSLSEDHCTGYEISDSLRDKDPYLIIVRWNGPLADFTYLLNIKGEKYRVATGDVMKATIVGNLITAYKNGVEIGQAKDDTYVNGLPGFGFNEGKNGEYGITRFSVAATNASGTAAPLAGQTSGQ